MSRLNDWFLQLDGLMRGYIASRFPGCRVAYEKNSGALDGRVLEMYDVAKELIGQPESLQVFLSSNAVNIIHGMTKTDSAEMLQGSTMLEWFPNFKPNMAASLGMRQKEVLMRDMAVYARDSCPVFWSVIVEHEDAIPQPGSTAAPAAQVQQMPATPVAQAAPPTPVQQAPTYPQQQMSAGNGNSMVSFPTDDEPNAQGYSRSPEWVQWYAQTGLYAQLLLEQKFPGTMAAANAKQEESPASLVEMYSALYLNKVTPEELDSWLANDMPGLAEQCGINQDQNMLQSRIESHPYYTAIREGKSPYRYIPITPSIKDTAAMLSQQHMDSRNAGIKEEMAKMREADGSWETHPVQIWYNSVGPLTKAYVDWHWPIMKSILGTEMINQFGSDEVQKWIDAIVAEKVTDETMEAWLTENAGNLIDNLPEEEKEYVKFPIPFPKPRHKVAVIKDVFFDKDPAFVNTLKGDPSGLPVCEGVTARKSLIQRMSEKDAESEDTEKKTKEAESAKAVIARAQKGIPDANEIDTDTDTNNQTNNEDLLGDEDEFDSEESSNSSESGDADDEEEEEF